jgi:hypothetical protein
MAWKRARQYLSQLSEMCKDNRYTEDMNTTPWRRELLLQQVQQLTRVCIANLLSVQQLINLKDDISKLSFSFSFKYHSCFPVIDIKS